MSELEFLMEEVKRSYLKRGNKPITTIGLSIMITSAIVDYKEQQDNIAEEQAQHDDWASDPNS